MYKLEFLEIAVEDIKQITNYILYNLKNKTAALNFVEYFIKITNNLIFFPYGNPIYTVNKTLKHEYRTIRVKNYIIFYTIEEKNKTIIITRIIYRKRNFIDLLE